MGYELALMGQAGWMNEVNGSESREEVIGWGTGRQSMQQRNKLIRITE